jgi:hypothetical protein
MPVNFTDNTKKIREAMKRLTETKVLVGVPSDDETPHLGVDVSSGNARKNEGKKEITNAELAYIHSNGAPEVNIPARPFLEPGIKEVQDKITTVFKNAAKFAMQGDYSLLDAVGLLAQAAARQKIADGIPPPLSPVTVAMRMRRTKASSYKRKASVDAQIAFNEQFKQTGSMEGSPTTPLLDTGQLVASISYVKRNMK